MFDIGFFELVIIGVIALVVLGPERLPHAVRMTSAFLGKFRRATMSIRDEIEREVNAYEIQQRLKEQIEDSGIKDAKEMLEETKQSLRNGILDEQTLQEIEKQGLGEYAKSLTEGVKTSEPKTDNTSGVQHFKSNEDSEESPKEDPVSQPAIAAPEPTKTDSTEKPA